MLHKVVLVHRADDEDMSVFMGRWHSRIKRVKETYNFRDWEKKYHRSVYSWGGHEARMVAYDAQRATYRVLLHKSWQHVQTIASQNHGNQLHGRKLHTWRWRGAHKRAKEWGKVVRRV